MSKVYEILMKLKSDTSEVRAATVEINKFKDSMNTLQVRILDGMKLGIGTKALEGTVGALKSIPAYLQNSVSAYSRQEAAEKKLASAMTATGLNARENIKYFKEMASQIQSLTTVGDETVLELQQTALNMGVSRDRMQECIEGAIGLQRAFGIGVKESIRAAAAVIEGKTEKLNELIPSLRNCSSAEEKLARAQNAMRAGFQQAKSEADTLGGSLAQLSNAWGDVSEIVGEALAPAIKEAASLLKTLAEFISRHNTLVVAAVRGLAALSAALVITRLAGFVRMTKAATAATAANTAATIANTAARVANTAAGAAQGAAFATAAAKTATAAGVIKTVLSGIVAAVGTVGLALTAAVAGLSFAWSRWRDATADARRAEEELTESVNASSRKRRTALEAELSLLRQRGGLLRDIQRLSEKIDSAENSARRDRRMLSDAGLDTSEIDANIRKFAEMKSAIAKGADDFARLRRDRDNAVLEEIGKLEISAQPAAAATDAQKIQATAAALVDANEKIADIQARIETASGAELEELRDSLKAELERKGALDAEFAALKKSADEKRKAREDEISHAQAAAAELRRNLELEIQIAAATARGDTELVKQLQTQEKIRQTQESIVEAARTRYTSAEELKKIEADALELARRKVETENAAAEAAERTARSKRAQQATENIVWRMAVAKKRADGDEDGARKLEEQQKLIADARQFAEETGKTFEEALALVSALNETEKAAQEAVNARLNQTEQSADSAERGKNISPKNRPRRPAVTGRTDSSGLFDINTGLRRSGSNMSDAGAIKINPPRGIKRTENPASMVGANNRSTEIQKRSAESLRDTVKTLRSIDKYTRRTSRNTQRVDARSIDTEGNAYLRYWWL